MVELIFLGLTINIFIPILLKLCSPNKEGPAMCSFIHLSGNVPAACYEALYLCCDIYHLRSTTGLGAGIVIKVTK